MKTENPVSDFNGTKIATIYFDGRIEVVREIYFECSSCGLCCKTNRIPVRERDIQRIQEHGYEIDQLFEEISPVFIPSKNAEGSFIKAYILRKKPFVHTCIFLDENNMCEIHEYKPLACRIYPFALRKEGENSVAVIVHPNSICPSIEFDVTKERSNTYEAAEYLYSVIDLE
ncbi:MAG: YkgJ family cysteine cluster protein [Candidatus Heimdallarchaeaceae archaeon]